MKSRSILIAALLGCSTALPARADPPANPSAVVAASTKKLSQVKSWSAKVHLMQRAWGDNVDWDGTISFRAPHLFYEQVKMRPGFVGDSLIVVGPDGVMWWHYHLGTDHQYMREDMKKFANIRWSYLQFCVDLTGKIVPGMVYGLHAEAFNYRIARTEELEGDTADVLEGKVKPEYTAKQPGGTVYSALRRNTVWIGRRTGFVYKKETFYEYRGVEKCPSGLSSARSSSTSRFPSSSSITRRRRTRE